MLDKETEFKKFKSAGEKAVREKIALNSYNQDRKRLAHEWLRQKEEVRINLATSRAEDAASRAESMADEQLRLSKSANRAAWHAAIAAWIAAITAIITIIGAIITINL
jgi:hypothetical protein